MRPEAHSSSSNAGRSKVLDALDVSERQSTFESGYMRFSDPIVFNSYVPTTGPE